MKTLTGPAQKRKYFKIEELCRRITSGGTPSRRVKEFYADGGIPWVKTGELSDWAVDAKQIKERITQEAIRRSSAKKLAPGTILMAMYGDGHTIGTLGWLREEASCNQACCVFEVDTNRCDNLFLFYSLMYHRNNMIRLAHGGAQRNLSGRIIKNFEIAIPSLPDQRVIATILSAYDDLIENNTRRIAILEEMARALYQEWFVHFRFPGHEHVPLVDSPVGSIPEGWEVLPFSSAARFVNGFAFKPSHWSTLGLPIVKIKELKNGITLDTPRFEGQLPPKYLVRNGDVLFSWSADLDAYIWTHGDAWLNQHLFLVQPRPGVSKLFVFYALRNRMGEFRARSAGTTMRHIKRAALDQVSLTVPEAELCGRFEQISQPIHDLIEILRDKNAKLRATRDLLLPKLISGEIDVSALSEAPIAEAAD